MKSVILVLFLYIGVQILPPSVKNNDVHAKHKMCYCSDVQLNFPKIIIIIISFNQSTKMNQLFDEAPAYQHVYVVLHLKQLLCS